MGCNKLLGESNTADETDNESRAGCGEGLTATGLLERVFGAVQGFAGGVPQGDDQTVVVLKVEGKG